MVKIYVQFPEDLQERAEAAARMRGITFDEFVRECVSISVDRTRSKDPLFADAEVFSGDAPTDLAKNHDKYLYESGT
jgi:hypothetical protein